MPTLHGVVTRGPKTALGKLSSSKNATKHGIFSKAILIEGESMEDFDKLLKGLRQANEPVGELEALLVERLATITWRQRRLLLAEGGEIQKNKRAFEWDQCPWERESSVKMHMSYRRGLIQDIKEPKVLAKCIELLGELQGSFSKRGFVKFSDTLKLEMIYGKRDRMICSYDDLFEHYEVWSFHFGLPLDLIKREKFVTREECKRLVMQEIDEELSRLNALRKKQTAIADARTKSESLSRSVPENSALDRLLRYETHLSRDFERTLAQLERLQRMRRGQPVPPQINVNLSKA
jgi:hypothetical protein